MAVQGIRGATVVEADDRDLILRATRELLEALVLAMILLYTTSRA